MEILFLPNFIKLEDEKSYEIIRGFLKKGGYVTFYLTPNEMDRFFSYNNKTIEKLVKDLTLQNDQILCLAPGFILSTCESYIRKYSFGKVILDPQEQAVPENDYVGFIPTVFNYYQKKGKQIEKATIILENEKNDRVFNDNDNNAKDLLDKEKIQSLEAFCVQNSIYYLKPKENEKWEKCLETFLKRDRLNGAPFHLQTQNKMPLFLQMLNLPPKFSILFTDRDGTIFNNQFMTTINVQKNFEHMKYFLEAGNIIAILSTTNHCDELFEEKEDRRAYWEQLMPYKHQIIGSQTFKAMRTLGGVNLEIGACCEVEKRKAVSTIMQYFIENGYKIDKCFAIGDGPLDFVPIYDVYKLYGGISAHIRKSQDTSRFNFNALMSEEYKQEIMNYINLHWTDSFSTFMEEQVFPTLNLTKEY